MSNSDELNIASINFENNTSNVYEDDSFVITVVTCASVLVVVTVCIVLCCIAGAWLNRERRSRKRRGSGGFYRQVNRPKEEIVINNNPMPLVPTESHFNPPPDDYEIPCRPFWEKARDEIDKLPPAPPVFPREFVRLLPEDGNTAATHSSRKYEDDKLPPAPPVFPKEFVRLLPEDGNIAASHSSRKYEDLECQSDIDDYLEATKFNRKAKKRRSEKKESFSSQNIHINSSRRGRGRESHKSQRRPGIPSKLCEESSNSDYDDSCTVPRGKRSTTTRLDMSETGDGGRRSVLRSESSSTGNASSATNEVSEEHKAEEGRSRSVYRSELHIELSSPRQSRVSRNSSAAPAVVVHVHINENGERKSR